MVVAVVVVVSGHLAQVRIRPAQVVTAATREDIVWRMRDLRIVILLLASGCVTRVQVCASAEHARHEYSRQSLGTSVCADFEPPPNAAQE